MMCMLLSSLIEVLMEEAAASIGRRTDPVDPLLHVEVMTAWSSSFFTPCKPTPHHKHKAETAVKENSSHDTMAVVKKKRYRSRSPEHVRASKRTHKDSFHISPRLQATGYNVSSSGIGPARDSSMPQKQDQEKSLPTGEDWVFRVKVISAASNLSEDLFNNAVQGLVQICFPDGILDHLGLQVLEQHMREEKAPTANIQRMTEVFQSEMVQRLISMLAEHLDTPAKIGLAVHAIVAATARLHGERKLGEDILGHVSTSFLQLKDRAPRDSTEWLASGDVLQNTANSNAGTVTGDVSEEEHVPTPRANKPKKRDKKSEISQLTTHEVGIDNNSMDGDVSEPLLGKGASNPAVPMHKGKDRRISTKWKWNIKPEEHTKSYIAETFTRTSDLFAYHALPIARRKLGPGASRRETRRHMQAMLDDIQAEEFEKWVESLQKLLDGDHRMLDRAELSDRDARQRLSRATPAPVDMQRRAKATEDVTSEYSNVSDESNEGLEMSRPKNNAFIKREGFARSNPSRVNLPKEAAETHMAERNLQSLRDAQNVAIKMTNPNFQSNVGGTSDVPILNLLWGSDKLTREDFINDSINITYTIMSHLQSRISAKTIELTDHNGLKIYRTQRMIEQDIMGLLSQLTQPINVPATKRNIEGILLPWVMAHLCAFPELKAMPFVFTRMQPSTPIAMQTFFGSWEVLYGISKDSVKAAGVDYSRMGRIRQSGRSSKRYLRAYAERVLRGLLFAHRDKFPELKKLSIVTAWEEKTGLVW
ncbi:hypothetical protein PTMSG1_05613 [Pyrenophora teres f. maculata]|nr:hypothetical protein PTMSG1_05613 [Pyrenophora teres f. maculata]